MRAALAIVPLLAGCGRVAFDASPDAAAARPLEFGAGCAVGLAMDEVAFTGAAGEVTNLCQPALGGTALRGASRVDDAIRGHAAEIPAPSGCIQLADAPALHATSGLTLSAWIYPLALDAIAPFGVIAKRTDFAVDDAEYTMFVWTDNTVWVDFDSRNDRGHGTRKIDNGRWQQLTAVFDGTRPMDQRVALYVDGVLDAMLPETSTKLTAYAAPLSVGCLPEQPGTKPQLALAGRIDDVGVWTRALSPNEVAAWYAATRR